MNRIIISLFVVVGVQRASADTCGRWVNDLDPCDGIVAANVCNNPDSWTPNQWISYKNWLYSSTPKKACDKFAQKHDGPGHETAVYKVSDDYYICYWDWDDNGLTDADWSATATDIELDQIEKDSCCSLVPNGRYKGELGFTPITTGGQFSKEQRDDIMDLNRVPYGYSNGQTLYWNKSDASRAGVTDPGAGTFGIVARDNALYYPDDKDPDVIYPYNPAADVDDAQVDHIIPRIDSNGCPCGTNSFANAAVISASLNASMGRSCLDSRRMKFIQTWTLPAGSPRLVSEPDPDAEPELRDAGGCNAAGGAGGMGALLFAAVIAARGRRRR